MSGCSSGMAKGRVRRFLPFMEGPRSCAGLALANMNLTATLALLYGHFSFRLADEVAPPHSSFADEVASSCRADEVAPRFFSLADQVASSCRADEVAAFLCALPMRWR